MLELLNLTCRYEDVAAVNDVSFKVAPGRICGLMGRNAAGKTTTMRAVLGLVLPASGTILWEGGPIGHQQRKRFSYFPAQRGLYPKMGIQEQLNFMGRVYGLDPSDAAASSRTWLNRLGLADKASQPLKSLSAGQQQRVQLAACLMPRPALAVLDEPFAMLDQEGIDLLQESLADLADQGCAVMVSSHQLDVMEDVCDDVAILESGRLHDHGALDEIRAAAGQVIDIRFKNGGGGDWATGLNDVSIQDIGQWELRRGGGLRVTMRLGPSANREAVLAAAAAAGEIAQCWWGPARLRDLYRDVVLGSA